MKLFKIALIAVLAWNVTDYFFLRGKKNAFVDISKIYNDFEMKKEYEHMIVSQKNNNKAKVDSMEMELKQLSMKVSSLDSIKEKETYDKCVNDFFMKRNKFMQIKNSLDYRYTENVKSYDEKIWNQINEHMKHFGADNSYDYIYGVAGSGSIMYASEDDDVTNEFVAYLNKKYKGE